MPQSPFESDWSGDTEWPAHDYVEDTNTNIEAEAANLLEGDGTILQPRPADHELLEKLLDEQPADPEVTEEARKKLERFFRIHPKGTTA